MIICTNSIQNSSVLPAKNIAEYLLLPTASSKHYSEHSLSICAITTIPTQLERTMNIAELPSDIIRKIITVGQESVESSRLVRLSNNVLT